MTIATAEHGVITEAGAIRFERLLPGPIERVWAYLTDSEKRGRWLASGPMELRAGGDFELVWRNSELTDHDDPPPEKYAAQPEHRMTGRIIEADPPRLLIQAWPESEVVFELAEQSGKVLLTLTHRRLPSRAMMVDVAGGWHAHLAILQAKLEGRDPPPFWAMHGGLEKEYEALIP